MTRGDRLFGWAVTLLLVGAVVALLAYEWWDWKCGPSSKL